MNLIWAKYKVFIMGLIGAIIYAVMTIDTANITWKSFLMPVVIAVFGYLGKNLRGQWQSIIGVAGTILIGYFQQRSGGTQMPGPVFLQWVLAQIGVLYFGLNAPPFKPITYEHNEAIVSAKEIPPVDQVPAPPFKTATPPDSALK